MRGLLTKVWRDLTRRRVRSALTVLGIAVGVGGLVAIVSTARELTRAQRALYASTSQADITFWAWNAQAALAPLLEADPRIAAVELRVTYTTRWRVGDRWRDIELIGLDGSPRVNRFDVLEGRLPLAGEMLLDVSAARALGLEPGALVAVRDPSGRERELRLSGISQSPTYLSSTLTNLDIGYVPAPTLRRLLDLPGSNQVLIALYDSADAQRVAERVQRLFQRQRLQAGAPEIRTPDQFPGKRELDALIVVMILFSGLGLVLSSALVLNTLSASVAEQSDEIAVLKALGGGRRLVLALYLTEALAYGVAGTASGTGLGALLGWRLLAWIATLGNATVSFRLAPEGLALGVGVGLAMSVVGGWLPARQAARASVREALASYGIRSDYGQGWLDRRLRRLRGLPPLAAMALRNLSRRPARTAMTLLVIALATAGFLGALATRDAVNAAIEGIYATYATDAWVWLAEEVGTSFEGAFTTVEGVQSAEGWALANGHVGLASARLWGLPAETRLYRPALRQGRWFHADEPDAVVLSGELADDQGLRVGAAVEIQVGGQGRQAHVVGIALDNTIFLGGDLAGKAFMPRNTLNRLIGREGLVYFFALRLASRETGEADRILAQVERRFARWRPVVQPVYAEIAAAREGSRLLTLALLAMLIIIALAGALGIVNTLSLNVLERRREIAVLRAMGGSNQAVRLAFVAEGLALGGLGGLLGGALGYPVGYLFTRQLSSVLFTLELNLRPGLVVLSLAFAVILAAVGSVGPASAAAHMPTSASLRYE